MDPDDGAEVPSPFVSSMSRLAASIEADQMVSRVAELFGEDVDVFMVDHAIEHLIGIGSAAGADYEIEAALRDAITLTTPFSFDGYDWTPIRERGQVVFVVRERSGSGTNVDDHAVLGLILRDHRRRFEDLESARRRKNMVVAAELQWDLLPVQADSLGAYDVAGILEPAYEVAGDVFDYATMERSLWIYSFDGMGHGLDATMAAVLVLAAIRNARRSGLGLDEQMSAASDVLFSQYGGDRFVTGAACRLTDDGACEVVNAGHEPMRRVTGHGRVTQLDVDVQLPLGVGRDHRYAVIQLEPLDVGDGLVLFSDGPAAARANGLQLGAERLNEALSACWSDRPYQTAQAVMQRVLDHVGDDRVGDDLTAVVVRRSARTFAS